MKKLLSLLIFSGLLVVSFLLFKNDLNKNIGEQESVRELSNQTTNFKLEDVIEPGEVLMAKITQISPSKEYIVYSTTTDLGFTNAKLWIVNSDGTNKRLIDFQNQDIKDEKYAYFSAISWKSDSSAFAYLKIWPTQIYTVKPVSLEKTLLVTKVDDKDEKLLNPSIGEDGSSYLEWINNLVIFENNLTIPESRYSVDVITGKFSKVSEENFITSNSGEGEFYSQRGEWKDDMLGSCDKQSIGSAGCAITSVAMSLTNFGFEFTPESLNTVLSENNSQGYVEGCDLKWYVIPNLAKGVVFKGAYDNKNGLERINYELSKGNQVIMGFKRVPFTKLQHWVLVKSINNSEIELVDPWETSQNTKTLKDFGGSFDYLIVYASSAK